MTLQNCELPLLPQCPFLAKHRSVKEQNQLRDCFLYAASIRSSSCESSILAEKHSVLAYRGGPSTSIHDQIPCFRRYLHDILHSRNVLLLRTDNKFNPRFFHLLLYTCSSCGSVRTFGIKFVHPGWVMFTSSGPS